MGKIRKILENELVGGVTSEEIYPVTSTKSVYNETNKRLDLILSSNTVVNISTTYNDTGSENILTFTSAINKVIESDRVLGFQGKFKNVNGIYTYVVFKGGDVTQWLDSTQWIISPTQAIKELNISDYYPLNSSYHTLNTAINSIEDFFKVLGLEIYFKTSPTEYERYVYRGSSLDNTAFLNTNNWELISTTGRYGNLQYLEDVNNVTSSGMYIANNTAINIPNNTESWYIEHHNFKDTTKAKQVATGVNSGIMFFRLKRTNLWGYWSQINTSGGGSGSAVNHSDLQNISIIEGYPYDNAIHLNAENAQKLLALRNIFIEEGNNIKVVTDVLENGDYVYNISTADNYISKTKDDEAQGLISFFKGIYSHVISVFRDGLRSLEFVSNIFSGKGFGIYKDESGQWHLEIDHIEVRKTLRALQLIIQEIEVEGGIRMQGSAIMLADRVEDLGDIENAYRIYFDSKGGKISNQFKIGDQARCHRVNTASELAISYYWRVVKEIGVDYIEVYKNNINTKTKLDLDTNSLITIPIEVDAGSSEPLAGDVIVGCGNITNTDRMAYIITTTIGPDTPKTEEWSYVNDFRPSHNFNLSKLRTATKEVIQADQVTFKTRKGEKPVSLPVEEWIENFSVGNYPEQYTYEGSTWLCLSTNVTDNPNSASGHWLCTVSKGDANYMIYILPSRGADFYRESSVYNATLTAKIYKLEEDITDTLHASCFVWERESENTAGDPIWNQLHLNVGNVLTLTREDLIGDTLFKLSVYSMNGQFLQQKTLIF